MALPSHMHPTAAAPTAAAPLKTRQPPSLCGKPRRDTTERPPRVCIACRRLVPAPAIFLFCLYAASFRQTSRLSSRNETMPGRPPKRPAEAGDPATTDADTAAAAAAVAAGHGKVKLPRLDKGGQEDFSSVVKNRLSSYTRTGQACDRCKVSPHVLSCPLPDKRRAVKPSRTDDLNHRSERSAAMPSPKGAPTVSIRISTASSPIASPAEPNVEGTCRSSSGKRPT